MNRTLIKNLLRLIRSSMSRFLAVSAIVSIGVAFFTGVSGTADIMGISVDEYSDSLNLKDITIYSNYGFDEADVEAVSETDGVLYAQGAKFTDVIGTYGNDTRVTRIHSLSDNRRINDFVLVSGRMPANEHEALAENGSDLSPGFPLGARIDVANPDGKPNENLKSDYFIITGTIDTPLYLNEVKENSTLSNQYIQTYFYINDSAFTNDYYTELNVLTENGKQLNSFTAAYEDYSKEVRESIEALAVTQQNARYQKLRDDALEQYREGLEEYEKAKKEFEEKTAEAEQELKDGEQEIADGQAALAEGENELAEGIAEYNRQESDARKQLADALALLNDSGIELEEKSREFEKTEAELLKTVETLRAGIEQLKQAKQGLLDIDDGLEQIHDAKQKVYDQRTVLIMDLLRQMDQSIPLTDLYDVLSQLESAAKQLKEYFPELAELKAGEITERLREIETSFRDDEAYLSSEEIKALIDELRTLEEPVGLDEREDIPAQLTDILRKYNPLTEITDTASLIEAYDRTMTVFAEIVQFMESNLYAQLDEIIESIDPDTTLEQAFEISSEELKDMIALLEEHHGEPLETIGDLVGAYDALCAYLEETETELNETRSSIIDALRAQNIEEDDIDQAISDYEALIETILAGLADGRKQLDDARAQLQQGYETYASSKAAADVLLEEGRRKIAEGQREIEENRRRLSDALAALKEGYDQLEKAKSESLEQLDDAKRTLDDAKAQIDAMAKGSWTVLDRKSHYASATYHSTIDQMRAIGDIFPLFFILVAALVCLTTMSRMVSEQRNEIGTLRALGYTRLQCAAKYLIYAAIATVSGCVIGSSLGLQIFPRIIYNAWRMMYILPDIVLKTPWKLVGLTSLMFLGTMELTTWLVIRNDMKEVPSSLMRPKAVIAGRRTLIEKIGFIWNRLSFTWKVTVRNIFRYRRRFIMTVAGVAGCCALMVTGYGIRDSVNSMVELQFDEIVQFDGTASISSDASQEEIDDLKARLSARSDISSITETSVYSAKVHGADQNTLEQTVTVEIFDDPSDIKDAYVLRTRIGHNPIELNDEGAVITERLAENLDLKKGDTFFMEDEDGNQLEVKISDISELYIYHHCYMTESYYRKLTGQSCSKKALFIHVNGDQAASKKLQNDLMEEPCISSIGFYDDTLNNFSSMVKSLDLIVWALIISSMALAFVVLGNLININVSERQREIATMKVLGFRRREVQNYIYKENNILTIIGALSGLPLGNWLHHYIMSCIEMDFVIFGRFVKPFSFVISAVLTVGFGILVNLAMRKNLDEIAMVESLKSVE